MPSLNFKKEFVDAVKSGKKRQTIRLFGKRIYKPGDTLYLYTGFYTTSSEMLGEVVCKNVEVINFTNFGSWVGVWSRSQRRELNSKEILAISRADGFSNRCELWSFLDKQYKFPTHTTLCMQLIKW